MSQFTISTGISTIAATQASVPIPFSGTACKNNTISNPSVNGIHGCFAQATNTDLALFRSCCNGAPVVAYGDGCMIYCEAKGQSDDTLEQCIAPSLTYGCFSSSPDPAANLTTTTSTTTGMTATNSATITTTSSKPSSAANALHVERHGGSYAAWGTLAMLAIGTLFGFMI